MDPMDAPEARLPDQFDVSLTGWSNPFIEQANRCIIPDQVIFAFREPYCARAFKTSFADGSTTYTMVGTFMQPFPRNGYYGDNYWYEGVTPKLIYTMSPGLSEGRYYYLMNEGWVLRSTMSNGSTGVSGNMTIYSYERGGVVQSGSSNIDWTVTKTGFYSVDYQPPTGNTDPLTITWKCVAGSGVTVGMVYQPLPDLVDKKKVFSARVTGVSVLWKNTSSVLELQGKLLNIQMPANTNWTEYTNFDSLANCKGVKFFAAAKGSYSFLKPSSLNDFLYQQIDQSRPSFDLDALTDYIAIASNVTSVNAHDQMFVFSYSIQYKHTDKWLPLGEPEVKYRDLDVILEALSKSEQHFENPLHLAQIGKYLKDFFGAVIKYGPAALKVAGTIASVL